jgi:16S rRNA (adenine1518-N6/adenine1519-N6)-dimethyltransferase
MKLSEIDRTLREIRVTPIKTLGQNFLHDQNLARWIVAQARLSPDDFVVEIGPGLGAITEPALATGAKIFAIEKDARLVNFLRERFAGRRFEVLHGDALQFDLRRLFPRGAVTLLGNLPYYASTQMLLRFLSQPTPISRALLMLQKEVAARLSAAPRSKDYGILTLIVQAQCRVEYLRSVPATVFVPRPEVDSALVRLMPRAPGELPDFDPEILTRLVRAGFSQRRKQLGKLLKQDVADWPSAAGFIGMGEQARAEELSLEQWIALANFARPLAAPSTGTNPAEQFVVVDKVDRVIGAAPRKEVHGNNFLHRAVHLFIFNRSGELLLQRRSRWKDRHPRRWDSSAAGHVNAGEQYDETAARELREELGVAAKLTRVGKIPASEKTGSEFIWLYRGTHQGPFTPARAEIESIEFFPLEVVAEWAEKRPGDFAPGFIECWRMFRSREKDLRLTKLPV